MFNFCTPDALEELKRTFLPGDQVRLLETMSKEPMPVMAGSLGKVIGVDDIGSIHVSWDCGSSLALIPGLDHFEKVVTE